MDEQLNTNKQTLVAVACLLLTNILWAGNALVARHVSGGDLQPISMNFLRWSIGGLVMLPFCGREIWQQRAVWCHAAVLWRVAIVAALGMVVYNTLLYSAAHHTSAINITLLNTCIPLATFVAAGLILKQWPKPAAWFGMGIAACGLLYLISQGSWHNLQSLSFNRGDVLMLLAVMAWAVYLVVLMPWGKLLGLSAMAMLNMMMLMAVVMMLPLFAWDVSQHGLPSLNQDNVFALLYIGVVVSVGSYLSWNHGIAKVGPAKASLSLYTMPVFSAILSYFLLHEGLQFYHWIGGMVIFCGLILAGVMGKRA